MSLPGEPSIESWLSRYRGSTGNATNLPRSMTMTRGFPLCWDSPDWCPQLMIQIGDLHFFTSNWWLVWYTGILVYQWVSSSLPDISSSYPNITKWCNLSRYLSHGHWFSGIELPGFPILGHGKSLSAAIGFVNGIDGSLGHHVKIWWLGLYHVIIYPLY